MFYDQAQSPVPTPPRYKLALPLPHRRRECNRDRPRGRVRSPDVMWAGREKARLAWLVPALVLAIALAGCVDGGGQGQANGFGNGQETTTTTLSGEETTTTALSGEETTTTALSAAPSREERLVSALRGGGYVIYFRHTPTDWGSDDQHPLVLSDCDTQRNLSAEGRRQARAIGEAIERLDIPIGRVLSSPFCRAVDTARLAFDRADVEAALENLETVEGDADHELRSNGLRRLLSTSPDGGTNSVLVGHGYNIEAVADVTTAEGDGYVFRPERANGFTHVATITPAEWEPLAERFGGDG